MSSKIGILNTQIIDLPLLTPQHNGQTAMPGLPVKAAEIIYQGCMVAYDPANSQAQSADPAMPATAVVVGLCFTETVDNTLGAKGDLTIIPRAVVARLLNDGNVTAAQLYTRLRVVDDHTVGVPAGDHTDRYAGLCVGLDDSYVWVLLTPENAKRGPVQVALTSTQNTTTAATDLGTAEALANALKVSYNALQVDLAALRTALITQGSIGG